MPAPEPLLVLTGPSGAGKSTLCRRVADAGRARGRAVGGVLTETQRDQAGAPVSIDMIHPATGARLALAVRDQPSAGPSTGRWHFDGAALDAGLRWCAAAPPDALMILDEVGPLELVQHQGWAPLLPVVLAHPGPALVVVRPSMTALFVERMAGRRALTIEIAPASRPAAERAVLAALGLSP